MYSHYAEYRVLQLDGVETLLPLSHGGVDIYTACSGVHQSEDWYGTQTLGNQTPDSPSILGPQPHGGQDATHLLGLLPHQVLVFSRGDWTDSIFKQVTLSANNRHDWSYCCTVWSWCAPPLFIFSIYSIDLTNCNVLVSVARTKQNFYKGHEKDLQRCSELYLLLWFFIYSLLINNLYQDASINYEWTYYIHTS